MDILILMNWKYLIMENIKLDGGHLSLEQLNAIFRTIPQEMDVLDANDRVVWSSMNENRLFKRTEKITVRTRTKSNRDGRRYFNKILLFKNRTRIT